jgi:hypothetical protein
MNWLSALHLVLHVLAPLAIAVLFFRSRWLLAFAVMLATMLVDLDHLLAVPVYAPDRCSIGFHPLHTAPAIVAYVVMLWPRSTRLVAIGLLTHMLLDGIDCLRMS